MKKNEWGRPSFCIHTILLGQPLLSNIRQRCHDEVALKMPGNPEQRNHRSRCHGRDATLRRTDISHDVILPYQERQPNLRYLIGQIYGPITSHYVFILYDPSMLASNESV